MGSSKPEHDEDSDASAIQRNKMTDNAQVIEDFDSLLQVGALDFYLGLNQKFDMFGMDDHEHEEDEEWGG